MTGAENEPKAVGLANYSDYQYQRHKYIADIELKVARWSCITVTTANPQTVINYRAITLACPYIAYS